jgi:hypothetical protein
MDFLVFLGGKAAIAAGEPVALQNPLPSGLKRGIGGRRRGAPAPINR